MGLARNIRALFTLPSERRVVSYVTKSYLPDEDDGEIESDEGEELDEVDFDDIDDSDDEAGLSWSEAVYDYLKDEGAYEASSSRFHPGIWYTAGDESWDQNGEMEEQTYHLKGFPKAEEREIYRLLKSRKVIH